MKRVILILTLLIMNAYAGNCYRMSNEELREIESSTWNNAPASMKIHSGVRCDNAIFLKLSMSFGSFRSLRFCCMYDIVSDIGSTRDIVLDGIHSRVVFDEFGMPIKDIDNVSKNASCEKLYLEFKSKVKDMR